MTDHQKNDKARKLIERLRNVAQRLEDHRKTEDIIVEHVFGKAPTAEERTEYESLLEGLNMAKLEKLKDATPPPHVERTAFASAFLSASKVALVEKICPEGRKGTAVFDEARETATKAFIEAASGQSGKTVGEVMNDFMALMSEEQAGIFRREMQKAQQNRPA